MTDAWRNIDSKFAKNYLRTDSSREQRARKETISVLNRIKKRIGSQSLSVIEMGCGNGERLELARQLGMRCDWTGIDISPALIDECKKRYPESQWHLGDVLNPEIAVGKCKFDVALFCHVLEIVQSPELALTKSKQIASTTVIEFFRPPSDSPDQTEILFMKESESPYLRHSINRDTYFQWLVRAGFVSVEIVRTFGTYEVHILT
jgi:ubiquinone/menaquinone biosynthesis C-methylase UbiE